MQRRPVDLFLGLAIWVSGLIGLTVLVQARAGELGPPAGRLTRYIVGSPRHMVVQLTGELAEGDPVLDGERGFLGRLVELRGADGQRIASGPGSPASGTFAALIAIDPEVALPDEPRFVARSAPKDARWVVQTLLPPHKREILKRELTVFVDHNGDALSAFLRPLAEDTIQHGMTVLEANLTDALKRREDAIKALLDRQRGMVKEEILPVLKERLGESAKKKAEPILTEIGRELWDALPMWSLSWRALFDTIPGTSQDRVDVWWAEFVETKAIPIMAAHEGELLKALEDLIEEGAADPEVRKALGDATLRLAKDPEFKELVRGVIEDALVRPFEPSELLTALWEDDGHQARLRDLERRFAPTLQRIGRLLTIDPETGRIDEDLARVLRRVVFRKDARWIELLPEQDG
jgi:hypothetical protein